METADVHKQPTGEQANKDQLPKRAYDLGHKYEAEYGNCPQCVIAAIQEAFPGMVEDAVFKAAHGLAGGTALAGGGTCGALVGGIMAIGAKHGRDRQNFANGSFRHNSKLAKRLYDKFTAEFGGCRCDQVQTRIMGRSFNLWDKDDYKAFEEAGGHRDKCPDVVGKTAAWTVEVLLEEESEPKP